MKLANNTIAATFAAMLIGGLAISPASAAVTDHGKVDRSASQQKVSGCVNLKDETGSNEWIGDRIAAQLLVVGW